MDTLSLILMIIGAINWGLVGIFQFDLVAAICGSSASVVARIIYTLQWRSISVKTYDNANVYPVLHGLEADEREIDGEYLIPLGEYMCFRQIKSESSIVLMYSEEQGRLYVFETVI